MMDSKLTVQVLQSNEFAKISKPGPKFKPYQQHSLKFFVGWGPGNDNTIDIIIIKMDKASDYLGFKAI